MNNLLLDLAEYFLEDLKLEEDPRTADKIKACLLTMLEILMLEKLNNQ